MAYRNGISKIYEKLRKYVINKFGSNYYKLQHYENALASLSIIMIDLFYRYRYMNEFTVSVLKRVCIPQYSEF